MLLGPEPARRHPPRGLGLADRLYWPLVTLLTVGGLTSLYHVSTPAPVAVAARRSRAPCSPWSSGSLASFFVRGTIAASLGGGTSIYGPLSAPIVLLIWLYALAIAVLIGAAFNAAIRELWPAEEQRSLRERFAAWTRCAAPHAHRAPARRAGWDDPFDGYGPGDATDDLGLAGLRDAARGPLTPISDTARPRRDPGGAHGAAHAARPTRRPSGGRPAGRRAGRRGALRGATAAGTARPAAGLDLAARIG